MNCAEEVIEIDSGFTNLLQRYHFALDGFLIRTSSQSDGKYCIYKGLIENYIAAICIDPSKFKMDTILKPELVERLIIYRRYLIRNSSKLGKINAFSI
jgi:hypothetical protein